MTSKLWSAIAPVWYSAKIPVACTVGLKNHESFNEALKMHLDYSSENSLYKYY